MKTVKRYTLVTLAALLVLFLWGNMTVILPVVTQGIRQIVLQQMAVPGKSRVNFTELALNTTHRYGQMLTASLSLTQQDNLKQALRLIQKHLVDKESLKNASVEFESPESMAVHLRQELVKRKVIHLEYEPFTFSEPEFSSEEDRKLFLMNAMNTQHLSQTPRNRTAGLVTLSLNAMVHGGIDCGWRSRLEQFQSKSYVARKKTRRYDILAPLLVPDSFAFQHFLDGVLPKLVQAYPFLIASDVKLLIYQPRDAIILEMYQRLGFHKSQLVFYSSGTVYADVMINTCVTPPLHYSLWRAARSMLGVPAQLPVARGNAHVILLTRAKSLNSGRRLVNSDNVTSVLRKRYGRRLVIFRGGYNLNQSIELFSRASLMVGVHGGAFNNMFYATKGTAVVEVMPTKTDGQISNTLAHTILWLSAVMLEEQYWRICESPLNPQGDVQLSISKLKHVLDRIDQNQVET